MSYIVVNSMNAFDPVSQVDYATEAEADAAARAAITAAPMALIRTAQVLKIYTAEVVVTAEDPPPSTPLQAE